MKQFAILLVLDPDVNREDAEEMLQRTSIEFGDNIVQTQMKEFDGEHGGVVIYQP